MEVIALFHKMLFNLLPMCLQQDEDISNTLTNYLLQSRCGIEVGQNKI